MSRFLRLIEAMHETRQREAERVVSRHQRMIEEARDYERHRAIKVAERTAAEAIKATASQPAMRLASRSAS